ncbi:MAG: hypothetical protein L6416_03705 [Candidatus Omnitrophica bacterium]|nr:hypothetical protein [Candidatus Omnitrophota bacterium]
MNSKIKISFENGELIIECNREGLKYLSDICANLSKLSDQKAKTPSNHYHLMPEMKNVLEGSLPTVIILNQKL